MNDDPRDLAVIRALPGLPLDARVSGFGPPLPPAGAGGSAPAAWVGILRRNVALIVGCVAVAVAATLLVTRRITPVYEASASMRIELQRPSLPSLEPLLLTNNDISTEMEVLRSQTLADGVVDSLALRFVVDAPVGIPRGQLFDTIRVSSAAPSGRSYRISRGEDGRYRVVDRASGALLGVAPSAGRIDVDGVSLTLAPRGRALSSIDVSVRSREEAGGELRANLAVDRLVREANIVTIRYRASDPEIARAVPNALATALIAQRRSASQSEARGTQRFLREQLDRISTQLQTSEEELRRFREREQVVDLQEEGRSEATELVRAQAARSDLETERAALAKLLANVADSARRTGSASPSPYRNLVAFPSLVRNQAAWQLLGSLATVEDRRTELLTRRSVQDPDVQVLTTRIKEIEEQLRAFGTTYLRALGDQVASLDSSLVSSAQSLHRFPRRELELTRLQRQKKLLEDLYTLLQTRLKEAEIATAAEDASVRLVDLARTPRAPVAPKPALNASLATLAGLLAGISFAFARAYTDRSVHSRGQVSAVTGMPVLGLIPRAASQRPWAASLRSALGMSPGVLPGAAGERASGRVQLTAKAGARRASGARQRVTSTPWMVATEAFNRLEANLAFARPRKGMVVVLTSPLPGDGKSTVATNLALASSRHGRRVLLIDADLRRGVVNTVIHAPRSPGLAEVLQGTVAFRDAVRITDVTEPGAFHCLTTGDLPPEPLLLLSPARVRELLDAVAASYDLVVIDTPPVNAVADAAILATLSDGVLLVARSGRTTTEALATGIAHLQRAHAPIFGVVLNDIDLKRDATYDSEYREFERYAAYYDNLDGPGSSLYHS